MTIKLNNINYVSLRVDYGYITGNYMVRDMDCIRGQREDTLNWDMIEKSFTNRDDAINTAIKLRGSGKIDIFDVNGYGIDNPYNNK